MPERPLPAWLSLGSQQSSSASSSAPRAPLWAHMLPWPGSGASPPGLSPWPQPRRRRLRRRRRLHAVLPRARPRQPVPSVGVAAATLHRGTPGAQTAKGAGRPLSSQAPARPSQRSPGSGLRALCGLPPPGSEVARPKVRALSRARSSGSRAVRARVWCASLRPAAARGSGALKGPRRLPQCRTPQLASPCESASRGVPCAAGRGLGGNGRSWRGAFDGGEPTATWARPWQYWGPFRGDLAKRCARGVGKPGRWIVAGSGVCSIFLSKN